VRKVIFWAHLIAGVTAGLVILLMSATGVLLTYEKQMIAWSDRTDLVQPPSASAVRLPIDDLLRAARENNPDTMVTGLTVSSVPGAPALATIGPRTIALNPYTGTVLGEASPTLRAFFRGVTSWHRWLAVDGPGRQVTRAITGWGNVLFLLIVMAGPFIWFPRKWTAAQFRAVLLFKGGLRGKARDFNWHNVIGIWSFVPLFVIVLSALPMSFTWANRALYRSVGETPPVPAGQAAAARGRGAAPRNGAPASEAAHARVKVERVIEPLWVKAEQQVEGWRTISARFGNNANAPLAFTIDRGTGGQPQLRGTLTLDRATGDVVRWESFDTQSTGRRLRTFSRFAHTGEVFGIVGQTIAGLASAGAVVLVWTGLTLTLRRFNAWRNRRREQLPVFSRSNAA